MNSKKLAYILMELSQSDNAELKINSFLDYLKRKNYLTLLPQIREHILRLQNNSSTANTLVISSKHDLSQSQINEIISLVDADENTRLELIKDESIIGGFSATYQGNIYDGSLQNQITQLRARLTY